VRTPILPLSCRVPETCTSLERGRIGVGVIVYV
jgi:hypothetical protein